MMRKGFLANVAVLLGIVAGAIVAAILGKMHFDKVASASWFGVVLSVPVRVADLRPGCLVSRCAW